MAINSYNEQITLIDNIVDADGGITESRKDVFCATGSVGYNEYYQATQTGLHPEIKFVLADHRDYNFEGELEYNGKRYNIIRTYRTNGIELELTCERVSV